MNPAGFKSLRPNDIAECLELARVMEVMES